VLLRLRERKDFPTMDIADGAIGARFSSRSPRKNFSRAFLLKGGECGVDLEQ